MNTTTMHAASPKGVKKGPLPLEGITVVSLEHAIAAPFCTRQLADMGARVIKIERPGVGDFARKYDERTRGMASHFVWTNRSKESLTLDLKHADAGPVLEQLLAQADVLVQNLAPGAAARMGLSFEALSATHPKLIVCDISGYGEDGPYRDKKAYDLLIQSEAGYLSVTGTPEQPSKSGNSIADIAAGMYAYTNILSALLLRDKTGQAREFHNYMQPVLADGAWVFLSGVRENPNEPFRFLRIPADEQSSTDEFFRLRAALADPALRELAIGVGEARGGGDLAVGVDRAGLVAEGIPGGLLNHWVDGQLDRGTGDRVAREQRADLLEELGRVLAGQV